MSTPAFAATLFVPDDYQTIQEAVDASSPGDVIKVGPGTFAGAYTEKQLTIVGSNGTVIDEANSYPQWPGEDAFTINGPDASGTEIRGMAIVGVGVQYGVYAFDADDVKVVNNVFDGLQFGIEGYGINDAQVVNNVFEGVYWGVLLLYSDDVKVVNNAYIDNFQSIRNSGGSRWIIEKNIIDGSVPARVRNGIVVVAPANDNEIRKNWIRHVGNRTSGLQTYAGVLLFELGFAELGGNTIEKNYVEISVPDLQDNDVSAGVSLVSFPFPGNTDGIVGNMILKNKLCGTGTLVHANPEELLASNLIEKNKDKCDHNDY